MKAQEITVEVKAELTVDRSTAEACLRLLEIYANKNSITLMTRYENDGTVRYEFIGGIRNADK